MKSIILKIFSQFLDLLDKKFLFIVIFLLILSFFSINSLVLNIAIDVLVLLFLLFYFLICIFSFRKFRLLLCIHLLLSLIAEVITGDRFINLYNLGLSISIIFLETRFASVQKSSEINFEQYFPTQANRLQNWKVTTVAVSDLKKDDVVVVKPGEVIPIDGVVVSGSSTVDESSISGNILPLEKTVGNRVIAGSINKVSNLQIKLDLDPNNWVKNRLINKVKSVANRNNYFKSLESFYSYRLVIFTLSNIFILFFIFWRLDLLNLSVIWHFLYGAPLGVYYILSFVKDIFTREISKKNIQVNDFSSFLSVYLTDLFIFGKSGILVGGKPEVIDFRTFDTKLRTYTPEEIFKIVYAIASKSNHPNSEALVRYISNRVRNSDDEISVTDYKIIENKGVVAKANTYDVLMGNHHIANEYMIYMPLKVREFADQIHSYGGTVVYIVINKEVVAVFSVANLAKTETSDVIGFLKDRNIRTVLLTGDGTLMSEDVARKNKLDDVYSEVSPDHKAEKTMEIKNKYDSKMLSSIGDSFNDIGTIITSDVSYCFNSANAVIKDVSSIIIKSNTLKTLPTIFKYSKKVNLLLSWLFWFHILGYPIIITVLIIMQSPLVFSMILGLLNVVSVYLLTRLFSLRILTNE